MADTQPQPLLSVDDIRHVIRLAQLPVQEHQLPQFHRQVETALEYMSRIQSLPTQGIPQTAQVTGMTMIVREDVIDTKRALTQKQVLANVKRHYRGYIIVDGVFEDTQHAA